MNERIKNRLWNNFAKVKNEYIESSIMECSVGEGFFVYGVYPEEVCEPFNFLAKSILEEYFARKKETASFEDMIEKIENIYGTLKGEEIHQFFEYIFKNLEDNLSKSLSQHVNETLKSENYKYQLSDGIFIPIIDDEMLSEIQKSKLNISSEVGNHLKKAEHYLSPAYADYQNSVKESISAVEALIKTIFPDKNKKTLGDILPKLEKIPQGIKSIIDKIHGYTSDAEGTRHGHGKKNEHNPAPGEKEAKYMLIICSASINLMKEAYPEPFMKKEEEISADLN